MNDSIICLALYQNSLTFHVTDVTTITNDTKTNARVRLALVFLQRPLKTGKQQDENLEEALKSRGSAV